MNIQQLHKYTSFISFGGSINVGSERHQSYPSSALVSLLPDVSVSATSWRLVTSPGSPITRDAGKHQKEPTSRKAREGMKKIKAVAAFANAHLLNSKLMERSHLVYGRGWYIVSPCMVICYIDGLQLVQVAP